MFGKFCYSLNSLAVRVPHNSSSRVTAERTPDPWPVAGGWLLAVAGSIKPMAFQFCSASLLVKPVVFHQFRLPGL